ncbi:MAG: hypothetical protein RIF41_24470, partial [Polyangiaceae bacterium]
MTTEGAVLCWGRGEHGELGNGEMGTFSASPMMVAGISDAVDVAVSRRVCARRTGGALSCWGAAPLGDGSDVNSSVPQTIDVGGPVVDVANGPSLGGATHSCAALTNGLKCWGGNASGQIGVDPAVTTYATTPGLLGGSASAVCAGANFSCRLDTDIRCWGGGTLGQLGNGNNQSSHQAVTVMSSGAA